MKKLIVFIVGIALYTSSFAYTNNYTYHNGGYLYNSPVTLNGNVKQISVFSDTWSQDPFWNHDSYVNVTATACCSGGTVRIHSNSNDGSPGEHYTTSNIKDVFPGYTCFVRYNITMSCAAPTTAHRGPIYCGASVSW